MSDSIKYVLLGETVIAGPWRILNAKKISDVNKKALKAWISFIPEDEGNGILPKQPANYELGIKQEKDPENGEDVWNLYMMYVTQLAGLFSLKISLYGERGYLLYGDMPNQNQKLKVWERAYRPGYYTSDSDLYQEYASAPEILDFEKTNIVLKDLPEDEFRKMIVETLKAVDDLGQNKNAAGWSSNGRGEERRKAYLDMVSWSESYRNSISADHSSNSSSCGLLIRNIWWLCGLRDPLVEKKYVGIPSKDGDQIMNLLLKVGVPSEATRHNSSATWNPVKGVAFNKDSFYPKPGDVFEVWVHGNSAHIFTISSIDKQVVKDNNGIPIVYDSDGNPAAELNFHSIDGGQFDGGIWGCQSIHSVVRPMKLENGRFLSDMGTTWRYGKRVTGRDGRISTTGRGLNMWIDVWKMKDLFTANYIRPVRKVTV